MTLLDQYEKSINQLKQLNQLLIKVNEQPDSPKKDALAKEIYSAIEKVVSRLERFEVIINEHIN